MNDATSTIAAVTFGPPINLPDLAIPQLSVVRTILVKIFDPNPGQIVAKYRTEPTYFSDQMIAQRFVDNSAWNDIPPIPTPPPQTRLDLNVGSPATGKFALVAFHLVKPAGTSPLSFIHDSSAPASAKWAVCGGHPDAQSLFFNPRWVGGDFLTARFHVSLDQPFLGVAYSLGVNIPDAADPNVVTPIFIDPKIKNN